MVNKTGNNDPGPEQQNKYHPASMINHVTQGRNDADTLKEKLNKIFDSSYQYYIKRELKYCVISANADKNIELNIIANKANKISNTHLQSIQNFTFQ